MTVEPTGRRHSASEAIAAEIRAELGRQRISLRAFALMLGVDKKWVTRRLSTYETLIAVDDIALMARALGRPPEQFLQALGLELGDRWDDRHHRSPKQPPLDVM
ncbi:MAG TPA: hypothetical protein VFH70_07765 [Acidimicrobiales bacterium]|nr:hypothetical protein [Acidimicrobiales bacterium]